MKKKKPFVLKKNALETALAPLEAYPPQAILLSGEDFIIQGCDGDHVYVWIARRVSWKGRDVYSVAEVYPGLAAKRTNLRDAKDAKDLVLRMRFEALSDILEDLSNYLFEDFEAGEEEDEEEEEVVEASAGCDHDTRRVCHD
jgi:hypothetical protein